MEELERCGTVEVNQSPGSPSPRTLAAEAWRSDALFCLLTDRIDRTVLQGGRLRVVANMAVGYDNVDLAEATSRGVLVTNTPGVLTETVADATFALILAVARRVPEGDRYVRRGAWRLSWSPMMLAGRDVHGKVLGIYGLGRIGLAVARRAAGFGMRVVYNSRTRQREAEEALGLGYVPFRRLLQDSDFLTIHVPLTGETRGRFGAEELGLMKRTAYLVNTARGRVVDQDALAAALQARTIAGAALDVFRDEPLERGSPLVRMDNVVLTPHLGSASAETRTEMALMAARNVAAALLGERPPNLINGEAFGRSPSKGS